MSLHTSKGGNIMGEDINGEDKKPKDMKWHRIANKEAVKIMILLHDSGKATLSEISEKRQKDNKIILLKLKGLMYHGRTNVSSRTNVSRTNVS